MHCKRLVLVRRVKRGVDIRPLKEFARKYLEDYPALREVILNDEDWIPAEEFMIKIKIWLRLLERS